MGKKYLFLMIFILYIYPYNSKAQNIDTISIDNANLIWTIEDYLETVTNASETQNELLNSIDFYTSTPLIISNSTPMQMAELPAIGYFEAYWICKIVNENPDITLPEIIKLVSLDKYQIYILENCTLIKPPIKNFNLLIRERTSYQLETPIGYTNDKYLGEKFSLYQRIRADYENDFAKYSVGGIINKNTAEPNINQFHSFYAMLDNEYFKIIAGDFALRFGMGNIFGDAYTISKGTNNISSAVDYNNKIHPYTSKFDWRVMRGSTARIDLPATDNISISTSLWFSHTPRSATLSKDSSYVSSLFTSSYYRTANDTKKINAINEINTGITIELNGCNYSVGSLLNYVDYSKEIRSNSSRAFSGKEGLLSSIYAAFYFDKITISSELSADNNQNFGLKFGTTYRSNPFDFAVHIRSFDAQFRSLYGSIFGEFSYPANELGVYTSVDWRLDSTKKISTYFDWFYSYDKTYTVDTNVTGFEIFFQYNQKFSRKNSIYYRFQYKSKTAEVRNNQNQYFYQQDKLNLRCEYNVLLLKKINVKIRSDFVYLNNKDIIDDEFGVAFFADVSYPFFKWLSISTRSTIYSTDSYESAIWQFKYFYAGYSNIPTLYKDGINNYISMAIHPLEWLKINLFYDNIWKFNTDTIGSSNELIHSNTQNRIYCQIEVKI